MKNVAMSITLLMLFCFTFYSSAIAKNFREDEIAYAASFIKKYGKDKVVDLIQSERKGHITLIIENELIDAIGLPNTDYVTVYTVCIDVDKIGWNLVEFKDKLWKNSSEPKAKTKVRRFTESSIPEGTFEVKSFSSEKTSTHSQFHKKDNSSSIDSDEQIQEIDRQIAALQKIAEKAGTHREWTSPMGSKMKIWNPKVAVRTNKAIGDLIIRKARLEAEMRNPQNVGLKMRNQQDEMENEIRNQQDEMERLEDEMDSQKARMQSQRAIMEERIRQQQSEMDRLRVEQSMQDLHKKLW